MPNKCFILLLILLISIATSNAQSSCSLTLKATVVSAIDHALLSKATILDLVQHKTYQPNKEGLFQLPNNCPGKLHIQIVAVGFESTFVTLNLQKDSSLQVRLQPIRNTIEGIDVLAKRTASVSSSSHRLSAQALEENKGKVLAESLAEISGVSTMAMGHSIVKPVINGLHSNRILMLNNGVRQEGQQWGAEHAPEIDPFVADRLEVIKGAQAVQYGADALAGVILISANKIAKDKLISGKLDLIARTNARAGIINAQLEGGIPKLRNFGWRVQASGKKSGNYKSADYYLGNTGLRELNYSATAQYKINSNDFEFFYSHFGTELGIFEGAHIGSVEDIHARIAHGRPFESYNFSYSIAAPRQLVDHDLMKLQWKKNFSNNKSLETQYSYQRNHRQEFDRRRVASDQLAMADMILTTQSLESNLRVDNSMLGMQLNMQVNNNQAGTGTTPIIPNFDSYSFGIFASHQLRMRKLDVELGVRYDYKHLDAAGYRYDYANPLPSGIVNQYLMQDRRDFHNISGTAGIQYPISNALLWKSNLGLAWRAPSANELYSDGVHHGSATYEVGDKHLKSEKGLKWTNALVWNQDGFSATLDLFGQLVYDYIYAQPNPDSLRQTIRGTFPLFAYEQHHALFYGADLSLAYQVTDQLSYMLNASLVRAKNISQNRYLPYIPSDRLKHGLQWDFSAQAQHSSYLKLSHRYVAKQQRYTVGTDYTAPPAAYQLVDVLAASTFKLQDRKQIVLSLAVDNVFNKAYKEYMDRFRYFAHQMGRNISVKISYQF